MTQTLLIQYILRVFIKLLSFHI